VRDTFCSSPYAVRLTRFSQSVLALPNMETRPGAFAATAAENWAASSTEGSLVTEDADALVLYSTCVPWRPDPRLRRDEHHARVAAFAP